MGPREEGGPAGSPSREDRLSADSGPPATPPWHPSGFGPPLPLCLSHQQKANPKGQTKDLQDGRNMLSSEVQRDPQFTGSHQMPPQTPYVIQNEPGEHQERPNRTQRESRDCIHRNPFRVSARKCPACSGEARTAGVRSPCQEGRALRRTLLGRSGQLSAEHSLSRAPRPRQPEPPGHKPPPPGRPAGLCARRGSGGRPAGRPFARAA